MRDHLGRGNAADPRACGEVAARREAEKEPRRLGIASAGGVSAVHAARKFGIGSCYTDYRELIARADEIGVWVNGFINYYFWLNLMFIGN